MMLRIQLLLTVILVCPFVGCGARNGESDRAADISRDSVQSAMTEPLAQALDVNAVQFRQQLRSSELVLVKFGAQWCGPCRRVDGELDKIAAANHGRVTVLRIDIDDEPSLASQYDIQSIPRMFLLHNGKKLGDWTGYRGAAELQQSIDDVETTPVSIGEVQANPFVT